jgi:hypothetical protein
MVLVPVPGYLGTHTFLLNFLEALLCEFSIHFFCIKKITRSFDIEEKKSLSIYL